MDHDCRRVLRAVSETPWAILREKLEAICDFLAARAAGQTWNGAPALPMQAAVNSGPASAGVAILPMFGAVFRRANMITDSSGGVVIDHATKQFRAALANPEVGAIVLQFDSPGGEVFGVDELSAEIFRARGAKPIISQVDPMAASAAYWIASAADEVVVAPMSVTGAIGILMVHWDKSAANEAAGLKPTYILAGPFKAEANPDAPLGSEARDFLQSRVDEVYGMFLAAVARNRGVSLADVRTGFGQGRVAGAREAVKSGLADRIGTLDDTLGRLFARGGRKPRGASAEDLRRRLAVASL